jgi:hypothetical protein
MTQVFLGLSHVAFPLFSAMLRERPGWHPGAGT